MNASSLLRLAVGILVAALASVASAAYPEKPVDGAYRGIGVPKSTPAAVRKEVSDMMDALNKDPEMRKKRFEGGFEVTDITVEMMSAFMKERTQEYLNSAKALGRVK